MYDAFSAPGKQNGREEKALPFDGLLRKKRKKIPVSACRGR